MHPLGAAVLGRELVRHEGVLVQLKILPRHNRHVEPSPQIDLAVRTLEHVETPAMIGHVPQDVMQVALERFLLKPRQLDRRCPFAVEQRLVELSGRRCAVALRR